MKTLALIFTLSLTAAEITVDKPTQNTHNQRLKESNKLIQADKARETFNINGEGMIAAIIDTGVNTNHPELKGKIIKQIRLLDGEPETDNAEDDHGHGTHISGIINSNQGIAPQAKIIAIKILNSKGEGTYKGLNRALQWIIDHPETNINVINISLGSSNISETTDTTTANNIAKLKGKNIPIIVSAGNCYKGTTGMINPACDNNTISVGAVYDLESNTPKNYKNTTAYTTKPKAITPFSCRSPNTTIFAPGADITSTGLGTGYSTIAGTSQAAAIITGSTILIQQYYKQTYGTMPTTDQIKNILKQTATTINDGDDENDNVPHTNQNYKHINLLDALMTIKAIETIKITSNPYTSDEQTVNHQIIYQIDTNKPADITWTIEDKTYTEQTAAHTYIFPGNYTIKVTATNGYHSDTITYTTNITLNNPNKLKIKKITTTTKKTTITATTKQQMTNDNAYIYIMINNIKIKTTLIKGIGKFNNGNIKITKNGNIKITINKLTSTQIILMINNKYYSTE